MNVTRLFWIALSRQSSQITAWYSFISKIEPYHAVIFTSDALSRLVDLSDWSFDHKYTTAFSQIRQGVNGGLAIIFSLLQEVLDA
jgi:hypothetical protein